MFTFNLLVTKSVTIGTDTVTILSGMHELGLMVQDDVRLQKTIDVLKGMDIDPKTMVLGTLLRSKTNFMVGAFVSEWMTETESTPMLVVNRFSKATIAHELTHVKQIQRGDMKMVGDNDVMWKGELHVNPPAANDLEKIVEYYSQPWEQEAYRAEHASLQVMSVMSYWVWFGMVHGTNVFLIKAYLAAKKLYTFLKK